MKVWFPSVWQGKTEKGSVNGIDIERVLSILSRRAGSEFNIPGWFIT
jgi:hypothetical protein